MSTYALPIRGEGRVSVPAYGIADAEHLVEKEISRALPGARVAVLEARRETRDRIVEEFSVEYRIDATLEVEAEDPEKAKGAAFRRARALLSDTRYHLTRWDELTPPGSRS